MRWIKFRELLNTLLNKDKSSYVIRLVFNFCVLDAQNFKTRFRHNYHLFTGCVIYRYTFALERESHVGLFTHPYIHYVKVWKMIDLAWLNGFIPFFSHARCSRTVRRIIFKNNNVIGRYSMKIKYIFLATHRGKLTWKELNPENKTKASNSLSS